MDATNTVFCEWIGLSCAIITSHAKAKPIDKDKTVKFKSEITKTGLVR